MLLRVAQPELQASKGAHPWAWRLAVALVSDHSAVIPGAKFRVASKKKVKISLSLRNKYHFSTDSLMEPHWLIRAQRAQTFRDCKLQFAY